MKTLFVFLISFSAAITSCDKGTENNDCEAVIITQFGIPCSGWGIKVNNDTYPSANIPTEFQQEGIRVCANYELYEDTRLCACCGGTWANIKSIKRFER